MLRAAIFAAAALPLLAVSCGDTLREPGVQHAPPLAAGEIPVGRWIRFRPFNIEAVAISNTGRNSGWYASEPPGGFEFRPDGVGYALTGHNAGDTDLPETARFIDGYRALVWTWHAEYRWHADGDTLSIQTTSESQWRFRRGRVGSPSRPPSDDVLIAEWGPSSGMGHEWWFRIGTALHQRVVAFQNCVNANAGRKPLEVEKCPSPFVDPEAQAE